MTLTTPPLQIVYIIGLQVLTVVELSAKFRMQWNTVPNTKYFFGGNP